MLRIVDKPQSYPISLAEAKAQLRIATTDTSSDLLISGLIVAATRQVQSLVQRVFVSQTLEYVLPTWRPEIFLPVAPVTAVNSIIYVDWTTQTQQTLDPSLYIVQTIGDGILKIFPKFATIWPIVFSYSPEPVVINFDAGYEDPSDLPGNVKTAILLQLRHLWNVGEVNPGLRRDLVIGISEKQFMLSPEAPHLVPDAVKSLILSEAW